MRFGVMRTLRVTVFTFKLISISAVWEDASRSRSRTMPSRSVRMWRASARRALDEIEAAHTAMRGPGRGRRYAAQQINQAYVVLLASQFQGFCRELHAQCAEHMGHAVHSPDIGFLLRARLTEGRRLDAGNPNPGNIGSDFGRFGVTFWEEVRRRNPRNADRQEQLETLMRWRNAVAHQDFAHPALRGRKDVTITEVRSWRRACGMLALDFEAVMHAHLVKMTGLKPW